MKSLLRFYCLLFTLQLKAQTNLYVDSSIAVSGTGTSWTTAFSRLNDALNVANAGSASTKYVIHIARGTYYPTGSQSSTNRDSTFLIARGRIQLLGGYPSGGGSSRSATNHVILSGNIGAANISTDNSYHVMLIAATTSVADTIVLEYLRIKFGYADGNGSNTVNGISVKRNNGAGIFASYPAPGRLQVNYSQVYNDTATAEGAGIFLFGTDLMLNGASIRENRAILGSGGGVCGVSNTSIGVNSSISGFNTDFIDCYANYGGGMSNIRSAATSTVVNELFESCPFTSNFANMSGGAIRDSSIATTAKGKRTLKNCNLHTDSAGLNGGHIYSSNYNLKLINTFIISGWVSGNGGGIYAVSDSLQIDTSTLYGNRAGSEGGAIFSLSPVTINKSIFWGDTAYTGGAIYQGPFPLTINQGKVYQNLANDGAGIYNKGPFDIAKTSFTGNYALAQGGAVYNTGSSGTQSFTNVVFSGNKANTRGGALYDTSAASVSLTFCTFGGDNAPNGAGIYNTAGSSINVINSIIWEGANNSIVNAGTSASTVTYSIVQGGHTGTGNSSSNPNFVGPNAASLAPTNTGIYSVFPCSPAVDSGLYMIGYATTKDIRDSARYFGPGMDMGAYEIQPTFPLQIVGGSSVCVNSTIQLTNGIPGGNWSSTNTAIATVNGNGQVTGISAGVDTISYTSYYSVCSATVARVITVLPLPVIPPITGNSVVCTGDTIRLNNATAGGSWSSLNTNIATVSPTGVVTGITSGTVAIRYFVTGGNNCTDFVSKNITVNTTPTVTAITGTDTLCQYNTTQLINTTAGGIWKSLDTTVATINQSGLLSPVSGGLANIQYTVTNNGCSATATYPVTIKGIDATITQNGPQLSSNQTGAVYRWIKCTTPVTLIAGGTTQNYTATTNGQYAVIVTINGCKDTSACVTVMGLGVSSPKLSGIEIFPNPTTGTVTIITSGITIKEITIRDITGKKLQQLNAAGSKTEVNLAGYNQGIYLIEVSDGNDKYTERVSVVH